MSIEQFVGWVRTKRLSAPSQVGGYGGVLPQKEFSFRGRLAAVIGQLSKSHIFCPLGEQQQGEPIVVFCPAEPTWLEAASFEQQSNLLVVIPTDLFFCKLHMYLKNREHSSPLF